MKKRHKYKPAVEKTVLLFLAGGMWLGVGTMLLALAWSWLAKASGVSTPVLAGVGVLLGLLVHHLGFLRIVDRNLARILPMTEKQCVFAFIPWRSYVIVGVMIAMGAALRHSAIPKYYLAVVYIGIGLALVLSSVRYMRFFWRQFRAPATGWTSEEK